MTSSEKTSLPDPITVAAVAMIAYALSNLLHEGAGHGGACLMLGGKPQVLSSVHFQCGEEAMSDLSRRLVSSAGTVVNYLAALLSLAVMKNVKNISGTWRYFLWLFTTINLLMAAGYFLFSGIGNIGDWSAVFTGLAPALIWRPLLAIIGGALYYFFVRRSAEWLRPFAGTDEAQMARARRLTMIPYIGGGLLYCISGLFNPVGPILIAISAAAASFGGASGLVWLDSFLRIKAPDPGPLVEVRRSTPWIAAGAVAALAFIGVLGPAIRF